MAIVKNVIVYHLGSVLFFVLLGGGDGAAVFSILIQCVHIHILPTQVVVKLRNDDNVLHVSGLIDADVERFIEDKFTKSLDMLNQFRTNLLDEHPQFDQNEKLINNFIANSRVSKCDTGLELVPYWH